MGKVGAVEADRSPVPAHRAEPERIGRDQLGKQPLKFCARQLVAGTINQSARPAARRASLDFMACDILHAYAPRPGSLDTQSVFASEGVRRNVRKHMQNRALFLDAT